MRIERRRAIEKWLWSGGRIRTLVASKLPYYFSDVDYTKPERIKEIFMTEKQEMTSTTEDYKDLVQLLILGNTGMITDEYHDHGFVFETWGDGWNEPEEDAFSCTCEQWEHEGWIQKDPARTGRPNLEDAAMQWREHILRDVYKVYNQEEEEVFDGDVSQDSDPF